MNETLYRWQGRIGSLKPLSLIVLIFIVIFFFPVVGNLIIALKNPSRSQSVTVAQLVSGQVGTGRYVSVSGTAAYQLAYTETEDGTLKALIYPLVDERSGDVIFVRTTRTELENNKDAKVTVAGITTPSSTDLKSAIEKDQADINSAGFKTSTTLYIEEGQKPGQALTYVLELGALGIVGLLSLVTFFFPTTVFHPYPVQAIPPDANTKGIVKATGNFQQVMKMEPLQFGKARRKFQNANSNLFFMEDRSLGVYIHFVFTQRVYGIQVRKQETDWMIIIKPMQMIAIEPGKIYAWRDTWAVSVRYRENDKEQSLLLHFDNVAAQASFVNYLREKGFMVSSGQYAVTGSTWS